MVICRPKESVASMQSREIVKVPQARIGVVIGKDGEIRRKIAKRAM